MFSRVNPHTRTPIPATLLVLALGVVVMLVMPGGALIQLITAGAIFNNIPYALTIVLYLVVRKKLGRKAGAFSLGRFEVPVAVVALAWVVIAIFVVSVSEATVTTFLIVGGLVLSGAVYLGYLLKCRREVLEREPGVQQF
jgi:amino acid transporter